MGGLEDTFLKKNIPGRYSSWADDNDDPRRNDADDDEGNNNDNRNGNLSDDISEDDEYYFEGLPDPPAHSSQPPPSPAPRLRPSGNTGVKGVLADYREFQNEEKLRKEEERLERLRILHRATHPAVSDRIIVDEKKKKARDESDSDSDFDDSDDGEFLKQFRNQRLAQLQEQSQSAASASSSSNLPTFGSLTQSTPEDYVQLSDTIDPRVFLIVHLYESTIQQCRMLHSNLEKIAQCSKMEHVKFIEVNALEANPNMDTIILPALLVYKGGELVHNLVRFTEELPRGYGVEEIGDVLEGLLGNVNVDLSGNC